MSELSIDQAFQEFKVSEIELIIKREIDRGTPPLELIKESQEAMERIGKKFETGDYYVAELLISANMFGRASRLLSPFLLGEDSAGRKPIGKIVLGTAKGDIHDLGKDIFGLLATAAGFQVIDLGVDVPPSKFIETVKEKKPDIVGMSALITTVFPSMKEVVDLLCEEGLREKLKVIIGGGSTGEATRRYVGADAFTLNAAEGVEMCRNFLGVSISR